MKIFVNVVKWLALLMILAGQVELFMSMLPMLLLIGVVLRIISMVSDEIKNPNQYDFLRDNSDNKMNNDVVRRQNEYFMEESLKNVTPWEHGGYDMNQGNSFNDPNLF